MEVKPFTIRLAPEVLADLRRRIQRTRWPDAAPAAAWEQGTDLEYLRDLLRYWAEAFDWGARENELNVFRQGQIELGGLVIHVVHERARQGNGIPLLLMNGWPSTFAELLPVVPYLTDPDAHGIDAPAFDVVIPSLPGFGFSSRPPSTGITMEHTATLWHQLMVKLGYERYGCHGSDFGSGVATFMALRVPEAIMGAHLSGLELQPYMGPTCRPWSDAEQAYLRQVQRWDDAERGYSLVQATRPQTIGYGLNDSPAGLAAWIIEKWRAWSDCRGDLESQFSRDFLLTNLTIYWATQTATSAARYYYDNRRFGRPLTAQDVVTVPTAIALFSQHFVDEGTPPREWVERLYNVARWTSMLRGGHFPAAEEPELLARDIAAFFATL